MPDGVIYMDNHATTRLDPRVLEAMMPYLTGSFGNPASRHHALGWAAEEAVAASRTSVATLIGAQAEEIVFTSGATESNNIALLGTLQALPGRHLVTCLTEHPSVLDPARHQAARGTPVTFLPVDRFGTVDPDDVSRAIDDRTVLMSLMLANNEIGTLHRIEEVARITRASGVLLHVDAAQAIGRIPVKVDTLGADLLSLSAHKFHGPKGIGALYIRRTSAIDRLVPLLHGGGQEQGLRPGTLNVPGVVGLGKACALSATEVGPESARLAALRDQLHRLIKKNLAGVSLNGHPTHRLPHNLNLTFEGVDGEAVIQDLGNVALSTGSACASADQKLSHVLTAIGLDAAAARSSVRFGLGRFTTATEVETVAGQVVKAVNRMRTLSTHIA